VSGPGPPEPPDLDHDPDTLWRLYGHAVEAVLVALAILNACGAFYAATS
jgi:hypothetical protein